VVEVTCAWTNLDGTPGREHWPGYTAPPQLYAALQYLRRAQATAFSADCCISAAGAVCHLTEASGTPYPLVVQTMVFNEAAIAFINRGEYLDTHREEWIAAGAYSIGLGTSLSVNDDDHWPGHLVTVIKRRWLVDTTLDQAGDGVLRIPGIVVLPVTERFLRGRATLLADLGHCAVTYEARPGDRSYRRVRCGAPPNAYAGVSPGSRRRRSSI
jgi:hypothetical protein